MKTAIIGLGNMGRGLARRLAGRTDLVLASRNEADAAGLAATLAVEWLAIPEALAAADIIVLGLPYSAALGFVSEAKIDGKILVDISNPLKEDFSGLTIGHDTSAGEEIQKQADGAEVVKAFNTIFAELFDAPREATANVPVFVAGNTAKAVEAVEQLVVTAGFAVENAGALDAARLLEPVGMLNIRLGYGLGRGTAIAPAWLKIAA